MEDDLIKKYGLDRYVDAAKPEKLENAVKSTTFFAHDEQGNPIGNVTVKGNPKASTLSGKTVYNMGDGKYTLDWADAKTSISLDKKTGKITVKAPEPVLKSKSFQQAVSEDNLKGLSALYKANHNMKVINPYKSDTDTKEDITIPELVERIEKGANKIAKALAAQEETRQNIRMKHGDEIANKLSEDNMIIMGTQFDKNNKKTSRQAIPFKFRTMFEAAGVEVADDGTVLGTDFLDKAWNLDKVGRDQILGVKSLVEDYFREKDFSDPDEYARMVAFSNFINDNDATGNKVGEFKNAIETGITKSVGGTIFGTLSLAEAGVDRGATKIAEFLDTTIGGGGDTIQSTLRSGTGFYGSSLGDFYDRGEKALEKEIEDIDTIDTGMAGLAKTTELLADVAQLLIPAYNIAVKAPSTVAKATKAASKVATKFDDMVKVAKKAGTSADDFAKVVMGTAKGADDIANVMEVGSQMLINRVDLSKAVEMTNKSVDVLRRHQKAVSTGADIVASSIVDAAITDPAVMRELIRGESENYNYVLEQFAWNAGGWGVAATGGKVLARVGDTAFGSAADALFAKVPNKVIVGAGNLSNKIKAKMWGDEWLKNLQKAEKKQVASFNKNVRLAREAVADEKIFTGKGGVKAGIERQKQNLINLRNLQNAQTDLERGAGAYIRSLNQKSGTIGDLDEKLTGISKKIMELEKAKGSTPGKRKLSDAILGTKKAATEMPRLWSTASANYRGATTEIQILENIRKVNGRLTSDQAKGLKALKKQRDAALKIIGDKSELRGLLDDYLKTEGKWWEQFDNIREVDGIISKEELQRRRDSGVFSDEDGYMYRSTPRSKEFSEFSISRRDGTMSRKRDEIYQYKWGGEDDFLDPTIARINAMENAGVEYNVNQYFDALKKIKGFNAKVIVSGQDVSRVEAVEKLKKPFKDRVKGGFKGIAEDALQIDRLAFGSEYYKRWNTALNKAENATILTGGKAGKVDKVTTDEVRGMIKEVDKKKAVLSLSDEEVAGLMSGYKMSWGEITNAEELAEMIGAADNKTKKLLKDSVSRVQTTENGTPVLKSASANASDTSLKISDEAMEGLKEAGVIKEKKFRISDVTIDNFRAAVDLEPELIGNLNRSMASGVESIRESKKILDIATDIRKDAYIVGAKTSNERAIKRLQKLQALGSTDKNIQAFYADLDKLIDNFEDFVGKDKTSEDFIEQLIKGTNTESEDVAKQFLILSQLKENEGELSRMVDGNFRGLAKRITKDGNKLSESEVDDVVKNLKESLNERIQDRIDEARRVLSDEGSELVNNTDTMSEIKKLKKKINGAKEEDNIIAIRDESGGISYVETDPITADLIKYRPGFDKPGRIASFFNTSAKIFRLGTTGVNLTSIINQTFRDSQSMFIGSGTWRIGKGTADNLTDSFGTKIVDDLKRFEPQTIERLTAEAADSGKSVERLAVERELALGKSASSNATETAAYRFNRQGISSMSLKDAGVGKKIDSGIDNVVNKAGKMNEARERWQRNVVYENSYYNAIKSGYSVDQARVIARFNMDNATTNFTTQMYHLRALQKTVPYLGAAVNGTKSFWRLLSVSPVSITTRFVGGAVIPTIALTGSALMNPETREQYRQLNEYEKDNNIIFPVAGRLYKIPAPQELGPLVAPFRQFVEHLYDANRHDFWELMLNDAVRISPIDFDGFVDIDRNRFAEDPNLLDRLGSGAQGVLSQVMPPPVKSAYMLLTGRDPYTGKEIDKSYYAFNDETGQVTLMDSSQSAFAQWFTEHFGQSGSVAAAMVSNTFGTAGLDMVDTITRQLTFLTGTQDALGDNFDEAENAFEGLITPIAETTIKASTKPLTVQDYDRTKADFNAQINKLFIKKESIINGKEYQALESSISQEDDPEKRQKLINQRNSLLLPLQEDVVGMMKRYVDQEGEGAFDQYRSAAVLSVLNPYARTKPPVSGDTAEGREMNREAFFNGKNAAMDTLMRMGADPQGTVSMLGYVTTDNDGNSVTKYFTPYEILTAQDIYYKNIGTEGSPSLITSLIKEELDKSIGDEESLKKQKNAIKQQINAMYGKGKLSNAEYRQIDRIKLEWNAKVIAAIDPYIQRVSPELVLRDNNAIDLLDNYILVPSEYEKVKGRYVSSGGGILDKQRGFARSYLKKIYGVK